MEYIRQYLENMSPDDMCALFMIDMDNLEEIRTRSGDEAVLYAVRSVSHMLSTLFRATDKITQTGESEFIVFIYGAISEKTVSEKARLLCENLQFAVKADPAVSLPVSVGVYISSGSRHSYEELEAGAREALQEAKAKGSQAGFYVKTDEMEEAGTIKKEETASGFSDFVTLPVLLQNLESGVSLLEVNGQIGYTYASQGFYEILGCGSQDISLPCGLGDLGICEEDLREYEQLIRDSIRSGSAVTHIQRVRNKDGENLWRRVRTVRLSRPDGGYNPVMLELSYDVTALMEDEQRLQEASERLKVVFEQTPHMLWEVDVRNRTLYTYDVDTQSCVEGSKMENFPESVIESGYIHPDSAEYFRGFAENLLKGSEAGTGNFIVRVPGGRYEWASFTYHMLYDRNGQPSKAVGLHEKLPVNTGFPGRPLPETVRHHLLCRIRVDVTADSVEELWIGGLDRTLWVRGISFFTLLSEKQNWFFLKGDNAIFRKRFNRSSLLEAFDRGEYWSSMVHRCIDTGGNICWMEETLNLIRDPGTGHIYMFACFVNIQQRHEWESLLGDDIKRDGTGGLYTLSSARMLSQKLIRDGSGSGGKFCAMAMIYIGGGERAERESKALSAEDIRESRGVALALALGPDSIASWYSEDTVLAFFPAAKSKYQIRRRIEDSFAYVKKTTGSLMDENTLHFCAGVALEPVETMGFDAMLPKLRVLCDSWRNSEIDMVAFADEGNAWVWSGTREILEDLEDRRREQSLFSEEEKKAVFDVVAALFDADTLEDALEGALRCIGTYHRADRVYLLLIPERGNEITAIYEWAEAGKNSIRQIMLGRNVEEIYVLKNCLTRLEPVFVKKEAEQKSGSSWHFMAYPLVSRNRVTGFLCVENAANSPRSDLLVREADPYIQKELGRFYKREGRLPETGSAADRLPNLHDYMHNIYLLNSDRYTSMGALAVGIPNYSSINGSRGFQYGREMLDNITEDLESIFGRSHVYRIWDAEFVVLFPDTIHENFSARCLRLRTRVQRRYPGQVQIGYTWTEGIFEAKNLVREAQGIMKCDSVVRIQGRENFEQSFSQGGGSDEVHVMKYVPYFQPKIDMRDGTLIGAEALVRGIDEEGNVVMPARFIEMLEKSGGIRELDFFMLEHVMKQLSQWQQMGYPRICVSVNMSRRTLFSPTALASVLAIESRYPDVSPKQIELEITETAGDVEISTLSGVLDQFQEYKIGFELDDFGSRYANIALLSNVRFNAIKLDRSLINDLPVNDISKMMVENIVSICNSFDMGCIAEGVETKQHEEILLRIGCTCGQGYYYSRPIPAGMFEQKYLTGKSLEIL